MAGEESQIPVPDTQGHSDNQASDDQRSGWPAKKRRNRIIGIALALVLALAGAGMVFLGMQGNAAASAVAVSGSPAVSYAPAPMVTAPFAKDGAAVADPVPAPAPAGPSMVSIPSIGVATAYEAKGMLPGKVLDLPADEAAWYDQSAPLGAAEGSTVFSGHVNTATGSKGPLGGLAEVKEGAAVAVTDADGTVHHFKIVSLSTVDKDKLDPAWFTLTGPRQVAFITCGGEVQGYNQYGLPIYSHNTVAVAVQLGH